MIQLFGKPLMILSLSTSRVSGMTKYNQFSSCSDPNTRLEEPFRRGNGKNGMIESPILGIYQLFIETTSNTFVTVIAGSVSNTKLFHDRARCRTFLFFLSFRSLAYTWPKKQSVFSKSCASTPRIISWHFANVQELTLLWARASRRRPDRYDMSLT